MRNARMSRFTIFDVMEARGDFASNPANADAGSDLDGNPTSKWPIEYPKMFYHPTGEMRILNPGETIIDPVRGPMVVGQQTEIIFELAKNAADEKKLRAAGWHDHPSKAIAAGGGEAPPISSEQRIHSLETELARLQEQLAAAKGEQREQHRR